MSRQIPGGSWERLTDPVAGLKQNKEQQPEVSRCRARTEVRQAFDGGDDLLKSLPLKEYGADTPMDEKEQECHQK